jgi:hypothetical protein
MIFGLAQLERWQTNSLSARNAERLLSISIPYLTLLVTFLASAMPTSQFGFRAFNYCRKSAAVRRR